ncbi:MAG: ABC transporter ATP-binding protein [Elusimicrobia bacterium]|nr:ABC transporter ATP-binding protein [Elusimicrobiota bacterium]
MEKDGKQTTTLHILKRLLSYLLAYPLYLFFTILLLIMFLTIEVLLPQISGNAINVISDMVKFHNSNPSVLMKLIMLYLVLTILHTALRVCRGILHTKMIQSALMDIRYALYNAVQRLSFTFHDNRSSGELISRVTRDIGMVGELYGTALVFVMEMVFYVIGSIIIMLTINYKLTLFALLPAVPTVLILLKSSGKMRLLWRSVRDKYSELSTVIQENIAGIRIVKVFGKEETEITKFNEKSNSFVKHVIKVIDYWSAKIPLTEFVFGLSVPIALGYGGFLIIHKQLNIGDITKFVLYLTGVGMRIGRLGRIINITNNAVSSGEKILEILDKKPIITSKKNAVKFPSGKVQINFNEVNFFYTSKKSVLNNISLAIEPGIPIAIVGPTSAGKTTLVNLIPKFYNVNSGQITINGINVDDIELNSLRKSVSIVFQESFLFSDTVSENISFGVKNTNQKDIEFYAQIAQAHEFITMFEDGYDTIIGERGVTLSGGQRQRIALARAIIMKPAILILDNATASVDSETERHIFAALEKEVFKNITSIVITHKLSLITNFPQIFVMDSGIIVDKGSHDDLLRRCEVYKKMYDIESGEEN